MYDVRKTIFLIVGGALVFAGAFFFRKEIFQTSYLGSGNQTVVVAPSSSPPDHKKGNSASSSSASVVSLPGTKKPVVALPPPLPVAIAPYTGRDPEEVRPVPDEVKLFTEEQKQKLYAVIQEDGRAVKINPEHFFGWIELGLYKKTIGDFEGARDALEYAGVIQPKNSLSFANLGELYWRYLHDYPKSEANLKISIIHKFDDVQTYITLAELYHYSYKEKYDLAPQVLIDGINANPEAEGLMRRLAYLYEQRSEWAKALEWWKKILLLHPGDEEVGNKVKKLEEK